jgi:hypothetical protein
MREFALLWLPNILVLGLSVWFVRHVVKNFGWSGLLLKFAVLIDGCFMAFVVAFHQTPWAAFRNHHRISTEPPFSGPGPSGSSFTAS